MPIGIAHAFIGTNDLWGAAAKHRSAILDAEAERQKNWGLTAPTWSWSAADVAE